LRGNVPVVVQFWFQEAPMTEPVSSIPELPSAAWPVVPRLDAWRSTRDTVHLWTQIVGKTRLATAPLMNHWWHVPLYVTSRGLSTSPMAAGHRTFEVEFDFIDHMLVARTNDGRSEKMPLRPLAVADFYHDYRRMLRELGIEVRMWPRPVEVEVAIPFKEDREHAHYDPSAVHAFWHALTRVDRVLQVFRGRFIGKASPVHFFWGAFDLAYTRFSGRPAPPHPGGAPHVADWVMREAYSHEVSSCGFWAGSGSVPEASFYAYAYPEPEGFRDADVQPAAAYYHDELREFVLPYEAVRSSAAPDETLLTFLQTTYEAAANLAAWDRDALERRTIEPPR
jgi:hypothetical protein